MLATREPDDRHRPLLRACRKRPRRRAAKRDDDLSPSNVDCHVTLARGVAFHAIDGTISRFFSEATNNAFALRKPGAAYVSDGSNPDYPFEPLTSASTGCGHAVLFGYAREVPQH